MDVQVSALWKLSQKCAHSKRAGLYGGLERVRNAGFSGGPVGGWRVGSGLRVCRRLRGDLCSCETKSKQTMKAVQSVHGVIQFKAGMDR
jgi:hypothetical protein